jgi:hypothetical protein
VNSPDPNLQLGSQTVPVELTAAAAGPVESSAEATRAIALGRSFLSPQQAQLALDQLEEWCLDRTSSAEQLDAAAKALRDAGYKVELSQIVHHALADPEANPHVGALWIRRVVSRRRWNGRYPDHMDSLCRQGEIGRRAVIEFLETMSARRKDHLVHRVLRKHRRWLHGHPTGWPATARALMRLNSHGALCRWMSDWDKRSNVEADLMYGLALALRSTGQEPKAHEVVNRALARSGAAEKYPTLELWYALEEALAGRTQSAVEHFERLEPAGWNQYNLCLYCLTRGVIRVQQAQPEERRAAFHHGYERIQERFRVTRVHRCGTLVRREYRRCLWRMSRDAGRLGPGLLATWRSAEAGWFVLPLLVIPGLQLLLPVYLLRLFTGPRRAMA